MPDGLTTQNNESGGRQKVGQVERYPASLWQRARKMQLKIALPYTHARSRAKLVTPPRGSERPRGAREALRALRTGTGEFPAGPAACRGRTRTRRRGVRKRRAQLHPSQAPLAGTSDPGSAQPTHAHAAVNKFCSNDVTLYQSLLALPTHTSAHGFKSIFVTGVPTLP